MDEIVRKKVEEKIASIAARRGEIARIAGVIGGGDAALCGIAAGMLYNSLHYQTRRVCGRSPTRDELGELEEIIGSRRGEILGALR